MEQHERIIRDCFWDSRISEAELQRIIHEAGRREKKQVFERILLHSTRYLLDLELFDREELREMLKEYTLPEFNQEHAYRRAHIAEVFFSTQNLPCRSSNGRHGQLRNAV